MQEYKTFTLSINVPIIKDEEGTIPMITDVKGMIQITEEIIAGHLSNKTQIAKPKDKSRFEEAKFFLREYAKLKMLEKCGVKTTPIIK